jgi:hypothetical protein
MPTTISSIRNDLERLKPLLASKNSVILATTTCTQLASLSLIKDSDLKQSTGDEHSKQNYKKNAWLLHFY